MESPKLLYKVIRVDVDCHYPEDPTALASLEQKVSEMIALGWKCKGGICVLISEGFILRYMQSMVKE